MKKTILSFLAVIMCAGLWAQEPLATPEQVAKNAVKRFKKEIGLTAEQTPKFQEIITERMTAIDAVTANKSLDQKEAGKKKNAAIEKSKKQLAEILTPEQMKKFNESVAKKPLRSKPEAAPKAKPAKDASDDDAGAGSDDGL